MFDAKKDLCSRYTSPHRDVTVQLYRSDLYVALHTTCFYYLITV